MGDLMVERARRRAKEAATDAAECIGLDRIRDARSLLAEAARHLDTLEERKREGGRKRPEGRQQWPRS
jgi:hypothetical protein